MGTASSRRFVLRDGLLLVAATAVGLAVTRTYLVQHKTWWGMMQGNPVAQDASQAGYWTLTDFLTLQGAITCMSVVFCLTQLILRLRTAHAPAQSWATGVGTSACLAACTAFAAKLTASLCWWVTKVASGSRPDGLFWWHQIIEGIYTKQGVAVLAVWVVLSLGRASHRHWDWVELFGFLLGCVLVLQVFADAIAAALP